MLDFNYFFTDLHQGAYLASSRHNSPELAEQSSFKLFLTVLYLYYMAILILLGGVLAKLIGPLHLDFLKASLLTGVIPYFFYSLFLKSLMLKKFDLTLSDSEKSKRIRHYHYVMVGSFCSFVGALIIVYCISTKSI